MTDLETLRLSLRRLAETTGDPEILRWIPATLQDERGWNRLCAFLCTWVERSRVLLGDSSQDSQTAPVLQDASTGCEDQAVHPRDTRCSTSE